MKKLIRALIEVSKRKDNTPLERLEYNRVRATIEEQCNRYLKSSEDEYEFEALPSAIDATLACLESSTFTDKYEFQQLSETCFVVRLKEFNLV